jgi:hypothetical protein
MDQIRMARPWLAVLNAFPTLSCILFKLKHEHAEVLYQILRTRAHSAQFECFISDKARTASVLNGLKNDPSDESIGEEMLY